MRRLRVVYGVYGVVDVLDRDRCRLVAIVFGLDVLPRDLRELAAELDGRHVDAQHGPRMRPRQGRILVRADGSRLRRPEDVREAGHRRKRSSDLRAVV